MAGIFKKPSSSPSKAKQIGLFESKHNLKPKTLHKAAAAATVGPNQDKSSIGIENASMPTDWPREKVTQYEGPVLQISWQDFSAYRLDELSRI